MKKDLEIFVSPSLFFIAILLGNARYCVAFRSHIITYQEKLGNYNFVHVNKADNFIITYQEKLGNYNLVTTIASNPLIITYQEKLGNYNVWNSIKDTAAIITYQEKLGNYNKAVCCPYR